MMGPVAEHSHHHDPAPSVDETEVFDAAFWDARYGSAPAIWSGEPNPQLVAEVAELTPTTALDVGCGEGADAVWLAERGWQVTALDISRVALDRAAAHARAAGPEIAERITWQQADLTEGVTLTETYGLVSAQFMQLPPPQRDDLYRALAALVAGGGTLLDRRSSPVGPGDGGAPPPPSPGADVHRGRDRRAPRARRVADRHRGGAARDRSSTLMAATSTSRTRCWSPAGELRTQNARTQLTWVNWVLTTRSCGSRAQSSVMLPPAAAIFSLAEAENASALTCTATEMSPLPRILTGCPARTAPAPTRSSTPTEPPWGNSSPSVDRLTT